MGKGGTEPDRDRSVLRIDETHKETDIKKNMRTVSEIVFVERTNQEAVRGDRERQQDVTTDRATASLTYDCRLVPSFQHSVLNTQDKSQSLSCRLQTVNQTRPASPCLTLPHGPLQGVGGEVRRESGMLGWRLKKEEEEGRREKIK